MRPQNIQCTMFAVVPRRHLVEAGLAVPDAARQRQAHAPLRADVRRRRWQRRAATRPLCHCTLCTCLPACLRVCSTLTQLPQGLHISGGGIISSSDAISFPRATVLQGKASGAEGCPSGGRGERAPAGGRDDAGAWLARRTSAPPSVRPSCKLCAKRLPLILCAGRSWN